MNVRWDSLVKTVKVSPFLLTPTNEPFGSKHDSLWSFFQPISMTVRAIRACMGHPALMTSTVSPVHVKMVIQETAAKVNILNK